MKNKYLISVIVPEIEVEYNLYIPNNKKMGVVKEKILQSINVLSNGAYVKTASEVDFIDRDTGKSFISNMYVKDTGIKNGTKIVVM